MCYRYGMPREYTPEQIVALGQAVADAKLVVDMTTGQITVETGPPDRRIINSTAGSLYSALHEAAGVGATSKTH